MLLSNVTIRVLTNEQLPTSFTIRLPKSLYLIVRKKIGAQVLLTFGMLSQLVHFEEGNTELELSEELAALLSFPNEKLTLQLKYELEKERLTIGPVFALVTNITTNTETPFGRLTTFCEELARYCSKQHAFFFVFSCHDLTTGKVCGYRYVNGEWMQSQLPVPGVIYNRIPTRKQEKSSTCQQFFQQCREWGIIFFNERFLNKWEVHTRLETYPEITPFLPKTELYTKASNLETMLQQYPLLYLKPIHGSMGRRIIRIQSNREQYDVDYSTFSVTKSETITSLLVLLKTVVTWQRRQQYIIQEGIRTITHYDRPIDFRILCNKGREGEWKVTSAVARVSAKQQFVSNIARGGSLYQIEEVLSNLFDTHEVKNLRRLLFEIAIRCAEIVELEEAGIYGEFGIDLAIDEAGKPWILEINTKPSKMPHTTRIDLPIRPSAKALVQFATFLSDFTLD